MAKILCEKFNNEKYLVIGINNVDETIKSDETAFIVDKNLIPKPPLVHERGKTHQLYYNPIDNIFWYEIEPRKLTDRELSEEINEKLNLLLQMQLESEGIL